MNWILENILMNNELMFMSLFLISLSMFFFADDENPVKDLTVMICALFSVFFLIGLIIK